jgi:hypothetical protein
VASTQPHPSSVWKKGLRFAGYVLGFLQFGAVDEDDPALHTLMEP